jgi:hypothetical protein
MKKSILLAAALALSAALPASAAEITFRLDDSTQNAILQLPGALDNCVSGLTMRSDPTVCRSISQFLQSVAGEVKNTQAVAAKEAAEKAEAAKAAPAPAQAPAATVPATAPTPAAPAK